MVKIEKDDSRETVLQKINKEIATLTRYGIRTECIEGPEKAHTLTWSNGMRRWISSERVCIQDGKVVLDANELLVQGISRDILEELLPELAELPLYRFSFEARQQREGKIG